MNILFIAPHYPFFDRASGDLRLYQILKALVNKHRIFFFGAANRHHAEKIGHDEILRYEDELRSMGVIPVLDSPRKILKDHVIDVVFFEFYFVAHRWVEEIRALRPGAMVIVDSVDIHYHRLDAKAKLTGFREDVDKAAKVKREELTEYDAADIVVVVTDQDRDILLRDLPGTKTVTIPNIHAIHEPVAPVCEPVLTFVGGFAHEPNTDAVLYFTREVLPLILAERPDVVFNIIGNAPPAEVQALEDEHVKVHGYVPDTTPYLCGSRVSVAPLRYGAGMKGKIGEAMALGLPVVTTSIGTEGFGLTPEDNVLVGDTPEDFAQQVLRILNDASVYERTRMSGWRFIRDHYSEERVQELVAAGFSELATLAPKRLPMYRRVVKRLNLWMEEQVMWRFKKR